MNKAELNKCAQKLHEAYAAKGDYSVFQTSEYISSWNAVFTAYGMPNYSNEKSSDFTSEALLEAIKQYDTGEGDFEDILKKQMERLSKRGVKRYTVHEYNAEKKEVEKKRKKYVVDSLDRKISFPDGNETTLEETIGDTDENNNFLERMTEKEAVDNFFLMAAELALKIPAGKNTDDLSPRDMKAMFYKRMIFTDMLSAASLAINDPYSFFTYNETKFNNSANIDFANSYYKGPCNSVTDFTENDFRPYSEFTGNPKDAEKSCADSENFARLSSDGKRSNLAILYTEVYIAYIRAARGENISKSRISERKTEFFNALREAYGTSYIY